MGRVFNPAHFFGEGRFASTVITETRTVIGFRGFRALNCSNNSSWIASTEPYCGSLVSSCLRFDKKDMFPRIRGTILKIPPGHVSTYGAIARAAGYPGAARQVVWALRGAQGLPWHRVVAAGGRIALPGEAGMEQRFRLEAEGVKFSGSRVRMAECEFKFVKKLQKPRTQPRKKKSKNKK